MGTHQFRKPLGLPVPLFPDWEQRAVADRRYWAVRRLRLRLAAAQARQLLSASGLPLDQMTESELFVAAARYAAGN